MSFGSYYIFQNLSDFSQEEIEKIEENKKIKGSRKDILKEKLLSEHFTGLVITNQIWDLKVLLVEDAVNRAKALNLEGEDYLNHWIVMFYEVWEN